MRFFEKFGVRVEERGGGIETPDEVAGYGEDEISGGASPYTLDLDLYNIQYHLSLIITIPTALVSFQV